MHIYRMQIKDRIVELRRVPAKDLIPNPKNWRTHPDNQANALRGLLAEVGFANAVLARETPDGLQLIDGHLRAETTGDGIMPVLVLEFSDEDADKLLAAAAVNRNRSPFRRGRGRIIYAGRVSKLMRPSLSCLLSFFPLPLAGGCRPRVHPLLLRHSAR